MHKILCHCLDQDKKKKGESGLSVLYELGIGPWFVNHWIALLNVCMPRNRQLEEAYQHPCLLFGKDNHLSRIFNGSKLGIKNEALTLHRNLIFDSLLGL